MWGKKTMTSLLINTKSHLGILQSNVLYIHIILWGTVPLTITLEAKNVLIWTVTAIDE